MIQTNSSFNNINLIKNLCSIKNILQYEKYCHFSFFTNLLIFRQLQLRIFFYQPGLVNDQLNQLYLDLELEGLSKKLTLEEGITSSSSDDNSTSISKVYFLTLLLKRIYLILIFKQPKKKRKSYSSLVMIYEENAPFPPTIDS